MPKPRFHLGIDLGTTNCALASIPADDPSGASKVLPIPQFHNERSQGSWDTLPSFLYLPPDSPDAGWIAGRWARTRAAETPGRVIHSAKSWLGHANVDRRAAFLPFGSTDLDQGRHLSPVQASARLLRTLAEAWNLAHPDAPLAEQDVAITVPASFDPTAQQLTLEAAQLAGFPPDTMLLEEPQAAFYAWQEANPSPANSPQHGVPFIAGKTNHVLVIDLGGGTTDFSLFAIDVNADQTPARLKRIAVSEHLLLGGDNFDLALAHHLENQLLPGGGSLPTTTFAQLLARCREIKEEALGGATGATEDPTASRSWPVAVARPGATLLSGTLRGNLSGVDILRLLIEGYLPRVSRGERPLRTVSGLREMGLPYAKDPAITRHLADFVRGRPRVDCVLFNGGLTKSPAVRSRLIESIAQWQDGYEPKVLSNHDPDLAVARGAARFLALRAGHSPGRIEAGTAHSYYLGIEEGGALCVLPRDTAPDTPILLDLPRLRAHVGRSVAFPLYRHARREGDAPGAIVPLELEELQELSSIEAQLSPPKGIALPKNPLIRVKLRSLLRSTGLLRIELVSSEPSLEWSRTWPLDFSTRVHHETARSKPSDPTSRPLAPQSTESPLMTQAAAALLKRLAQGSTGREKLTANVLFTLAEKSIGSPRANWSAAMVRALFDAWMSGVHHRKRSVDQEEAWLQLGGYLLRPGTGAPGDERRVESLFTELLREPSYPRPPVRIQRWICARRIAPGLDAYQTGQLWEKAAAEWKQGEKPTAEIALLAGSLEKLPISLRVQLAERVAETLLLHPAEGAAWKSLGRLLSRALLSSGAENVVPADLVITLWEKLREVTPPDSVRPDTIQTWLRAARKTGVRTLDVSSSCRNQIDDRLRKWGVPEAKRRSLHEVIPVAASDLTTLLGEGLPPGLSLDKNDKVPTKN
ncbi:MAG TPA: Hsp70 family protein [Opitutaceae bacterium]|nr:Hsp70 family protein [Opitutaceae bacterium]